MAKRGQWWGRSAFTLTLDSTLPDPSIKACKRNVAKIKVTFPNDIDEEEKREVFDAVKALATRVRYAWRASRAEKDGQGG